MSDFTDAPRLYFDKLSVAKYNFEKLRNLRSQIARISALHLVLHSRYKVALVLQRNCTLSQSELSYFFVYIIKCGNRVDKQARPCSRSGGFVIGRASSKGEDS